MNAAFGIAVLNNLLGGGMSSRLFQNIREKRGLAYAVFSEITPYSDAGMFTVYAGTAKETVDEVLDSHHRRISLHERIAGQRKRNFSARKTTSRAR